jgi:hypothetical protein
MVTYELRAAQELALSFIDAGFHPATDVQRHASRFIEARSMGYHNGSEARVVAGPAAMHADIEIVVDEGDIVCSLIELSRHLGRYYRVCPLHASLLFVLQRQQ